MGTLKIIKFDKYTILITLSQSIKPYNYFQFLYDFNSNKINAVLEKPFTVMFPARNTLMLRQYQKSKVNDRFIVIALNVYSRIKPRPNGFSSINHYSIGISSKSFSFFFLMHCLTNCSKGTPKSPCAIYLWIEL